VANCRSALERSAPALVVASYPMAEERGALNGSRVESQLARRRRGLIGELRIAVLVGTVGFLLILGIERDLGTAIGLFVLPFVLCVPGLWRFRRDYRRFQANERDRANG
jgi:hypothetical protein